MIFPNKIQKGDIIATTAVSMGCLDNRDTSRLENGVSNFEKFGYTCLETNNVRHNEKLVSSDSKERAKEFLDLWKNEKVKWIIATSGGEILLDMLPYLDEDIIRKGKPKWVEGYSDPSLLTFYLTTNFNIATLNGANVKSFGMEPLDSSLTKIIDILENPAVSKQKSFELFEGKKNENGNYYEGYNLTEEVNYKALYKDKGNTINGRVIGGCIDVISTILGTKFDNTVDFCNQFKEGMLWYIDNCENNVAGLYRTLWQMKQAHWFDNANGFLIGRNPMSNDMFDFTYEDALHKAFDDMNVPVFYDIDIGHIPPQWLMINGSMGEFKMIGNKGELTQRMEG